MAMPIAPSSEPSVVAAPRAEELASVPSPGAADNLEIVEGIGPRISALLQAAGIRTFAQLAGTDVEQLRGILAAARLSHLADPATWPEQASLAAADRWAELEALQAQLKGGRRVR
jgi:large subunit ribosomal protein L21